MSGSCGARKSEGGSGLYQLGAEFLWTTSPHELSLRRVIAKLAGSVGPECEFRSTDVKFRPGIPAVTFRTGAQPAGTIRTVQGGRTWLVSRAISGVH